MAEKLGEKMMARLGVWVGNLLFPRGANCLCCHDPRLAALEDCLCDRCRRYQMTKETAKAPTWLKGIKLKSVNIDAFEQVSFGGRPLLNRKGDIEK